MSGAAARGAADARVGEAWRALRADGSVQFDLMPVAPPKPPPAWARHLLEWLRALLRPVGRGLAWLGRLLPDAPYARILLWSVLAAGALALAWLVVVRVREGAWRLPRRRTASAAEAQGLAPEASPLRAWLAEADALAAEGRFAQAAHHLLFRAVEDIARRRPQAVRPALTSRELAAASAIPAAARAPFAGIAALVERSLFGGRAVGAADWAAARAAYADLVAPGSWRG